MELEIGGMTCASCATRVEKKLNKLDGATATVNFATEKARVSFPAEVSPQDLISVVEQAGYTASLPAPPRAEAAEPTPEADDTAGAAEAAAGFGCPGAAGGGAGDGPGAAVPRLAVAVAGPGRASGGVGAWPFHRAALVNARHRAATMDTLISVGVAAAFL